MLGKVSHVYGCLSEALVAVLAQFEGTVSETFYYISVILPDTVVHPRLFLNLERVFSLSSGSLK